MTIFAMYSFIIFYTSIETKCSALKYSVPISLNKYTNYIIESRYWSLFCEINFKKIFPLLIHKIKFWCRETLEVLSRILKIFLKRHGVTKIHV